MTTYKIVRMYRDDEELNGTVVETGLTLEEARAWCSDRETSSSTATDPDLSHGPWFDGYEPEEDETSPDTGDQLLHVEKLSFRRSRPQVWHDGWRNTDRVMRYQGSCIICSRRTYAFDDGENDPRGVLGDHAASPLVAEEYERVGKDVPLCFDCANDYDRYQRALKAAERKWSDPVEEGGEWAFDSAFRTPREMDQRVRELIAARPDAEVKWGPDGPRWSVWIKA